VDINGLATDVAPPQQNGVTSSIHVTITGAWGAFRLHTDTSFLGYRTLHFQAQGSPNFNFFVGTDSASSPATPLATACSQALSVGAWSDCSVDLQAFGATPWVYLTWQAGTDGLDSFYLADVYLEGQAVF